MKKIRVFVVNLSKKNVLIRKFVRKSYILLKKLQKCNKNVTKNLYKFL